MAKKKRTLKPFSDNEPCGCDSGLTYKRCCKRKGIVFGRNAAGRVFKQIKLVPEAIDILEKSLARFKKVFGRKAVAGDLVLFDQFLHGEKDTLQKIRMIGRASNTREELIYSYMKTGLIATQKTVKLMPDKDLDELEEAVSEFFAVKEMGLDPFYIFSELPAEGFEKFKASVDLIGDVIVVGFNSVRKKTRFSDRNSYYQHRMFCSALNSMRTINEMFALRYDDHCLAVLRGIYEQYLRIKLVRLAPTAVDRFDAAVHALMGLWPYATKRSGSVDYTQVIDPETGARHRIQFSNAEILRISDFAEDQRIYGELYPYLSGHVHQDITGWYLKGMVTQRVELDRDQNQSLAISIILLVSTLLLFEMWRQNWLASLAKRDLKHTIKRLCQCISGFVNAPGVGEAVNFPPCIFSVPSAVLNAVAE